ncbi:MAG: hypothetical protein ACRD1H_15310, partial [Vicinamibacterales bacterium]
NGLLYEPADNLESSASITIDGEIAVNSTSGGPGTVLTVDVAGFGPSEQVRFEFVDSLGLAEGITTVTTLASGERSVQFAVPQTPRGDYLIRATGLTGGLVLDAPYTVTPTIAHPSIFGNPGNLVTFTFKGYLANESIEIVFVHGFGEADEVIGTVAADADGAAVLTVTMPPAGRGYHTVRGDGGDGTTTQSTWEVIPKQVLNRYFGPVGRTIEMTLDGWVRNTEITVRWHETTSDSSPSVVLGTVVTDNVGHATYSVVIPEAAVGNHRLEALGGGNVRHVYCYVQTTMGLSTLVGPPGSSVDASLRGFGANEQVEVRFFTTATNYIVIATVGTNGSGSVDTTLVMPSSTRGAHKLQAVGLTSGVLAQRWFYLAA